MTIFPIQSKYLTLSRLYFSPFNSGKVILIHPRPATAKLIELAEQERHVLSSIREYDKFCDSLRSAYPEILPESGCFSINGKSADWVCPFQITVAAKSLSEAVDLACTLMALKDTGKKPEIDLTRNINLNYGSTT